MNDLVYPRERVLGVITLLIGLLVWLLLVVGTFGGALLVLLLGFIVYLFVQSTLIAHIKGNGVALSEAQFPDLHAQFVACCEQLQMKERPQAYVMNGNGGLNAFATKFLRTQYVVLLSDVVDAMRHHPDGVRFYVGHELGHLRMKHLSWHFLRWPVLWLPLVGAAYSRARESTCDRHGAACSSSPDNAARAIAALAAGGRRWQQLDVAGLSRAGQADVGLLDVVPRADLGVPVVDQTRVASGRSQCAATVAPQVGLRVGGLHSVRRTARRRLRLADPRLLHRRAGRDRSARLPGLHRARAARAGGGAVAGRARCVGRVLPAPRTRARVAEGSWHSRSTCPAAASCRSTPIRWC